MDKNNGIEIIHRFLYNIIMIKLKNISLVHYVFLLLGLVVGFSVHYFFTIHDNKNMASQSLRIKDQQYPLINPLLACGYNDAAKDEGFNGMRGKIDKIINDEKSSGNIDDVGVYFRDLDSGKWTGVNEDNNFSPASLIKVQLMIAYYKLAESDKELLTKKYKYTDIPNYNQAETYYSKNNFTNGKYYAVDDLIRSMIINSDNNAYSVLYDGMDRKTLDATYADLQLSIPKDMNIIDFESSKSYSIVLRLLYNATYLNKEMSNKALALLSDIKFRKGIASALPGTTVIADKFGERAFDKADGKNGKTNIKELHDCGIVYYPSHPYLLCVMTKGKDFVKLEEVIHKVSQAAYEGVKNNYK